MYLRSIQSCLHPFSSSDFPHQTPSPLRDSNDASSAVVRGQGLAELDTSYAPLLRETLTSFRSPYSLPHSSQCTSATACVQSSIQSGRSGFGLELRHTFQRQPRQCGRQQNPVLRSLQIRQQPGNKSSLPVLHGRINGSVGCRWSEGYRTRYAARYVQFRRCARD